MFSRQAPLRCCSPGLLALLLLGPAQPGLSQSAEARQPAPAPSAAGRARPPRESFAPEVEIQTEDYAQARRQFRTRLLRRGPSPQPGSPLKPPPGVATVEYQSGPFRLRAWMNRPADGAGKRPAVLFLHGGFAFDRDDWKISQPYRDAGFVVLTPMLRGENGQPGAYTFFYGEVDDVLAAADCLAHQPGVDAQRLYLAGPSAGGTLVLLAAMTSRRFRAAASFSASPDQVLLCKHARHAARDVPVDLTDRRELQMRSPLAYAASLKCPTRIYYGSQEPHFRATSRRTAEVARQHGRDVEAIQVSGDHQTSVPPAIQRSIRFFQEH